MKSCFFSLALFFCFAASALAQEVIASQLAAAVDPEGSKKVFIQCSPTDEREISVIKVVNGEDEILPDNPADAPKVVITTVIP